MSLLQEALKRKEQEESQRKPEAESAEKVSSASPAEDANLSAAGQQAAEVKNTGIPLSFPPQSMPVAGQTQDAVSQNILAPRSAIALPGSAGGFAEASALRRGERDGESAEPEHRKTAFLWIIVAVIAISVGLTITAGIAFLFYRVSSPVKVKTVQQAGPVNNTTAVVAAGDTNISAGQLTFTQTIAVAQNAETKSVRQQSAGNAESSPAPAKPVFFKPKTPHAVSQAVRWPALKLTGILRGTGKTESTAFINGKMISTGQTIADVTIVEIQANGVILKYGNENRFLRVGAVSY